MLNATTFGWDAADAHPNPGAFDEHDRVFLDHAAQVRHDFRLPLERSVRFSDPSEERRLLVFRQRVEGAPHRPEDVIAQPFEALEHLPFEALELRQSLFRSHRLRQEGERVHGDDERLVQELLEAHRDLHRRGHPLEVHLDRAARDARDVREGAERHLSLFAQPAKGVRVEPHVQPSGRGVEEGRDALFEELAERPPGEDRHAEPGVDDAILQGSGPAPFANDERRSLEDSRDLEQFARGVLAQRVDVLEDLDDQERVISTCDEVEAQPPFPVWARKEESRLREAPARLLEDPVAFHPSFIVWTSI